MFVGQYQIVPCVLLLVGYLSGAAVFTCMLEQPKNNLKDI